MNIVQLIFFEKLNSYYEVPYKICARMISYIVGVEDFI